MDPVKIAVGNVFSCIIGELPPHVQFTLSAYISYQSSAAFFQKAFLEEKAKERGESNDWNQRTYCYWQDKNQSFYTGMLSVVRDLLKSASVPYIIDDRRVRPTVNLQNLVYTPPVDHKKRPYQDAAIDIMYKASRGILQAGTGSGKTAMVAELIGKIKTGPFLFIVLSRDLLEQAYEFLSTTLNVPIGKIGDGQFQIYDINVITAQTAIMALNIDNGNFDAKDYIYDDEDTWEDYELEKDKGYQIADLIRNAKGLYFDESHHVACKTATEVLRAAKNAYWRYGGTATPFREDGAEMMLQALFGKILVNISLSYLIREKYLLKPYIFFVNMGDEDFGDWRSWSEIYKNYIVENAGLNENVVKLIRFFESKNITSLTLVKHYNHGDNIKSFYPELHFIKGNQTRKQRLNAVNALRNGDMISAMATTLADEGLDVRRLNAAIIAGGGKSITRALQRVGRTLRPFGDQDKAIVIFFRHNCKFLDKHYKKIRSIMKSEEEFVIKNTTPEKMLADIEKVLHIPTQTTFL